MDFLARWLSNLFDFFFPMDEAMATFAAYNAFTDQVFVGFGATLICLAIPLYAFGTAVHMAYEKAYEPARERRKFSVSSDIRLVALGAMFKDARSVTVVTEKPMSFSSRWLFQLAALCLGNRLRFFHANMEVSEVARYAGRAKVLITGPFSEPKPDWVYWLDSLDGVVLTAYPIGSLEVARGAVLPPVPAPSQVQAVRG